MSDRLIQAGLLDNMRKALRIEAKNWFAAGGSLDEAVRIFTEVAAAEQKPGEGHIQNVRQDQKRIADVRPPMPEGQNRPVHQDQSRCADGHPIASGEARKRLPEKAIDDMPPARDPVSPIRDEGHTESVRKDQKSIADVPNQLPHEGQQIHVRSDQKRIADAGNPIASGEAKERMPEKARDLLPPAREPSAADRAAAREIAQATFFHLAKLRGRAWVHYRGKDLKNVRAINNKENALINDVIDYFRMNRISEDMPVSKAVPEVEFKKMVKRADTAIHAHAQIMVTKAKRSANG